MQSICARDKHSLANDLRVILSEIISGRYYVSKIELNLIKKKKKRNGTIIKNIFSPI